MANSIVYLVSDLVAQVRVESDLALSQVFTDNDLAVVISDAGSELRDIFTATWQKYDMATFDFTLTGGVGLNFAVLPQDFQQGHSVDINPTSPQPFTLKYLPNWLNRNSCNLPFTIFGNGMGPKAYTFFGNELVVLPAVNAGGVYRLYYTPTWTPLMAPQPVPPAVPTVPATLNGVVTGTGVYSFAGAAWSAVNVGDTLNVSGCADAANNGSFLILNVLTPDSVTTNNAASVSGVVTSAVVTVQPKGTRPDLPQNMNPWIQYIKTQAIISVRVKRGQPVESFEARLQVQKDRIATILQERQEEPTQTPWLRGRGDMFGGGAGGLW